MKTLKNYDVDQRLERLTTRSTSILHVVRGLSDRVFEVQAETPLPDYINGDDPVELGWAIPVGVWSEVPAPFITGGPCHVYGIPSLKDEGASSKALFQADPCVFGLHRHPYRERICIIKGRGEYWTQETGRVLIGPGDVYYFERGQAHAFRVTTPMQAFLWFWDDEA